MTGEDGAGSRPSARGRRASFAERRERKAAIDDPAVVLEAAARFLEPRARSVAEVRRRLTGAGYRADLVEGAIDPDARARDARRRGVRPRLGRVARSGAATRRTGDPPGARAQGRRPRPRSTSSSASGARRPPGSRSRRRGGRGHAPDQAAAERLLRATPAASRASRTPASAASAPTRCSPATASIPRSAATVAAQVEMDADATSRPTTTEPRRRRRCGSVAGRLTLGVGGRRLRGRRTTCRFERRASQHRLGRGPGRGPPRHGDWSFRRRTSAHSSTILRHARPDGRNRIWIP